MFTLYSDIGDHVEEVVPRYDEVPALHASYVRRLYVLWLGHTGAVPS